MKLLCHKCYKAAQTPPYTYSSKDKPLRHVGFECYSIKMKLKSHKGVKMPKDEREVKEKETGCRAEETCKKEHARAKKEMRN